MKFIKMVLLFLAMLVLFVSCAKDTSKTTISGGSSLAPILQSQLDETQEENNEQYHELVGTWKFYTEVPGVPDITDWTWTFNEDGTFSETYHGDTGTFTVNDSILYLTTLSKTRDYPFEIREKEGEKELVFLMKMVSKGTYEDFVAYSSDGIDYYKIFNKKEE